MDQGQAQFMQFFMDRVQNGKQDEARVLLSESFAKMGSGTMDAAYMAEFAQKMEAIIKPEAIDELKEITKQFGSQF